MNIPKEIALNQLITIPFIRRLAKKMNDRTGSNGDETQVKQAYDLYAKYADIREKAILELGPGHTYQRIQMALANGPASADIVDTAQQIDQAVLDQHRIKFTLYEGGKLPFADKSFDFIWSNNVYEHLHYPDVTVSETWRVLKPGGIAVHWIDLRDHFVLDNEDPTVFNMMRYKMSLWKLMTWNRSTYVNRLRFSEWIYLHKESGFKILHTDREISSIIQQKFASGEVSYLQDYTAEDAETTQMLLVVKK